MVCTPECIIEHEQLKSRIAYLEKLLQTPSRFDSAQRGAAGKTGRGKAKNAEPMPDPAQELHKWLDSLPPS